MEYFIDANVLKILLGLNSDEASLEAYVAYIDRVKKLTQAGVEVYITEHEWLSEDQKEKLLKDIEKHMKVLEEEDAELDREFKKIIEDARLAARIKKYTQALNKELYQLYGPKLEEQKRDELNRYLKVTAEVINKALEYSNQLGELLKIGESLQKDDDKNKSTDIEMPRVEPIPRLQESETKVEEAFQPIPQSNIENLPIAIEETVVDDVSNKTQEASNSPQTAGVMEEKVETDEPLEESTPLSDPATPMSTDHPANPIQVNQAAKPHLPEVTSAPPIKLT